MYFPSRSSLPPPLSKKSFEYLNPLRNGSLKPFNDLIKQLVEVIKLQLSYFKS